MSLLFAGLAAVAESVPLDKAREAVASEILRRWGIADRWATLSATMRLATWAEALSWADTWASTSGWAPVAA